MGHSNFPVKWELDQPVRRHITRRPSFRNFLIRRLWISVKNQKWIFCRNWLDIGKKWRGIWKRGGRSGSSTFSKYVSIVGSSLNSSQARKASQADIHRWNLRKWMESIDDAMFSNSVISWYGVFWKWYRWKKCILKQISATIVVATLDAVRETTVQGAVQEPYHYGRAQRYYCPSVTLL